MSIKDKVVIITGGSSGIGKATAKLLVEQGANVILGARREEKLVKISEKFKKLPGTILTQKVDVTKRENIQQLIKLALDSYGRIDVFYNNAGIMPQGFLRDRNYDEWEAMINTNIMGTLNGVGEILPVFRKQKDGLIIATDSVAGHVVYSGSVVYNATKFAIRAIMEGLRQEEKDAGIKSTLISPGAVSTNLVESISNPNFKNNIQTLYNSPREEKLVLTPEDVAKSVVYAIDQPKHVTISEIILRPTKQDV
ncbi:SDR family oxidoreductase [Lactobacillus sp. PV037]|uniref:SDR family oxidoreductase n=1 Tax=unclassified Lactobacillus TaxID=2620435 RepID=UPI0022409D74|nr:MULTISPECIES: SDR family oxidoreductase [unclassified Lactobacillus]QNQ82261.1 SDR family oxidoreductase [Lactobacillus sp. PV012]QNQ83628.1 SDR family oxidoreductase [Lactobacillus sp. PV037]